MTNQHVKQNGKLEDNPTTGSPPRTTLLGTIFSPVFNFFSPANKNGKYYSKRFKGESDGFCYEIAALSDSTLSILVYKPRVTAARYRAP